MNFLAIDFETADYGPDSACAVGLVRVAGRRVVSRRRFLIRPPRRTFVFTPVHGIRWEDVRDAPPFGDLWPQIREEWMGVEFVAAHNARFDRSVLEACCEAAEIVAPTLRYLCTVRLARVTWGIRPTNLANVCRVLNLPLNHHEPLSDAEACARIVLEAAKSGPIRGESVGFPA